MSAIQQTTLKKSFPEIKQEHDWKGRMVAVLSHPWTKRAFAAAAGLGALALLYSLQRSHPSPASVDAKPSLEAIVKVLKPCVAAKFETIWDRLECYSQATHKLALKYDDVKDIINSLEIEAMNP